MLKAISKWFRATRFRRVLLWLSIPTLILLVAGYFFACRYAKSALTAELEKINDGKVSVGSVSIGFNRIHAKRVQFFNEGQSKPWLDAPAVSIQLSLWQAVFNGKVSPDLIALDRPSVRLEFDENAKLTTKLPQSQQDPSFALHLKVERGEMELHQKNRKPLKASNIHLELQNQGDSISMDRFRMELLNGSLSGNLKRTGEASQASIQAKSIDLNSEELKQLALVPESQLEGVLTEGSLNLDCDFELQGTKLTDFKVICAPRLQRLLIPQFGKEIKNLEKGTFEVTSKSVKVAGVKLDVLGGELVVDGAFQIGDTRTRGKIKALATKAQMEEVCSILDLPVDMKGPVTFTTNLDIDVQPDRFVINGNADGAAADFTIETLPAKRVDTKVRLVEVTRHFQKTKSKMTGEVLVDCVSNQHNVGKLIAALGTRFDVPVPTVEGFGKTDVHVVVPLDRSLGKPMYWADIAVNSNKINLADIKFKDVKTDMTLYPDSYKIKSAKAISSKNEKVEFSGLLDFKKDDELIFTLGESHLAASLLSHYINQENLDLDGDLLIEGQLNAKRTESGSIRATGKGKVASDDVTIEKFHLTKATSDLKVEGDVLQFQDLNSNFLGGKLKANAKLSISRKVLSTQMELQNVDIEKVAKQLDSKLPVELNGLLNSNADVHLKLDPFKVTAKGKLNSKSARVGSLEIDQAESEFEATDHSVKFSNVKTALLGGSLNGSIDFDHQKNNIQIDYDASNLAVEKILSQISESKSVKQKIGAIEFFGRTKGSVQPLKLQHTGYGKVATSYVKNDQSKVDFQILGDHKTLVLKATQTPVAEGLLDLTAEVGLDSTASTSIEAKLKDVSLRQLIPQKINGAISLGGKVSGDIRLENVQDAKKMIGTMKVDGFTSSIKSVRMNNLSVQADLKQEQLNLVVTGKALQGNISASTRLGIRELTDIEEIVGTVELKNGRFKSLADALRIQLPATPSGLFSAKADITVPTNDITKVTTVGTIEFDQARLGDTEISPGGKTNFKVESGLIEFNNIEARIGNGFVRGRLSWPIATNRFGRLQINARRIDMSKLNKFMPHSSVKLAGSGSGELRGVIRGSQRDVQIKGTGTFSIENGKVAGIEWSVNRAPISWAINPFRKTAEVRTRGAIFSVLNGQIKTDGKLVVGKRLDFELSGQVKNIDSNKFKQQALGQNVFGNQGKLHGKLKLAARNFRSIKDLRGSFKGTQDRAQAFQLPVIDSISPYVNRSQMKNRRFEQGRVDLVLQNSKIRVQQVAFADQRVQVMIDGGVWLNGRLELQAIVHIGPNKNDPLRQLIRSPLLASSSPPVALIARIDQILADRLLFFKITGTFQRPRVQIQTTKIIQQEALKFILDKTYNLSGQSNSLLNRSTIRLR